MAIYKTMSRAYMTYNEGTFFPHSAQATSGGGVTLPLTLVSTSYFHMHEITDAEDGW